MEEIIIEKNIKTIPIVNTDFSNNEYVYQTCYGSFDNIINGLIISAYIGDIKKLREGSFKKYSAWLQIEWQDIVDNKLTNNKNIGYQSIYFDELEEIKIEIYGTIIRKPLKQEDI